MATTKKVARKKVTQKAVSKKAASLKSAQRTVKKTTKKTAKKTVRKVVKKGAVKTGRTRAQRTSFDEKLEAVAAFQSGKGKKPEKALEKKQKANVPSKLRLKKPALRNTLALSVVTAANFPANIDALAIQTARLTGVAFVLLGGFFALNFSQYIWDSSTINTSQMLGLTATSACDSTQMTATEYEMCLSGKLLESGTEDTSLDLQPVVEEDTEKLEEVIDGTGISEPPASFTINEAEPLQGGVKVLISVDNADRVRVLAFQESYLNPIPLGDAKLTSTPNVWEFDWDTEQYADGQYKVAADIYNQYHVTNPYREASAKYLAVNNSDASEVLAVVDTQPVAIATIVSSQPVDDEAVIEVRVVDAEAVRFVATYQDGGSPNALSGGADEIQTGVWRYKWDTSTYGDGTYDVTVRVKNTNSGQFYRAADLTVTVKHPADEATDSVKSAVDLTTDVVDDTTEPDMPEQQGVPDIDLKFPYGKDFTGTGEVTIETLDAQTVTLYAVREGSATKQYIGNAMRVSKDVWIYRWYTRSVPNADYDLFAEVTNAFGTYESKRENVTVYNEPVAQKTATQEEEMKTLEEAVRVAEEISVKTTTQEIAESEEPEAEEEIFEREVDRLIADFSEEIDDELQRFAAAYRTREESRIEAAYERIENLKRDIVARIRTSEYEETLLTRIEVRIDEIVAQYKQSVDEVDKIIAERVSESVFRDSDGDGITDYDEISIFNTDPYSADSDGDGFIDGVEVENGFDPTDPKREVAIVHESPKEKGVVRADILKVERIEAVQEDGPIPDTDGVPAQAVISGRALPNSYVTVYIFSTPVVVTVKTDEDGAWRYRFDKELEDGEHNVYVGVTDNAGRIVAKSEPFTFIKEAQAFSPIDAAVSGSVQAQNTAPADSLLSQYMIYLIISISVVSIGLVLILLGLHLDARNRRYPEVPNETP